MAVDTQKAFDLSVYSSKTSSRLAVDAASLSIEAQRGEHLMAVPYHYLVNFVSNTVVSVGYDQPEMEIDIRNYSGISSEVFKMCEYYLDKDNYRNGQAAMVWISGPDPYPDSRVGLGVAEIISENEAVVRNYGGLLTNLSEQECLDLAREISGRKFLSVFELRDNPLPINYPEALDPWEFILGKIFNRYDLLDFITSGEADRIYQERLEITRELGLVAVGLLERSKSKGNAVLTGAWMELAMMTRFGIFLDGRTSGCGFLNIDSVGDKGKYVERCGNCNIWIGKVIRRGYQCSCGKFYEGC